MAGGGMAGDDLGGLIERLASLSLASLEKNLPALALRHCGLEELSALRALRLSLDGKPEQFWADALIGAAEGDHASIGTPGFRLAYAEAQYKRAGILFKAGAQEAQAAKAYFRAALAYRGLGRTQSWRQALKNRASVLAILGQGGGSLVHLDQAVRSYQACILATDAQAERALWAELHAGLGYAWQGIGIIGNERAAFEQSIAAYEAAARVLGKTGSEAAQWSRAKNGAGATYALLGGLKSDPEAVLRAIAAYHEALEARPIGSVPALWLASWTNIMHAESVLSDLTGDTRRLRRAHDELLERLGEAEVALLGPAQRAHVYGQLGTNAQKLGESEKRVSDLRAAIGFYDQALGGGGKAINPNMRVRIELHRAAALFRLGDLERDARQLRSATEEFERLEFKLPQKDRPQLWAYWQQMRGRMHQRLAELRQPETDLLAARRAFEAALQEHRREIYPQQWAETTRSLCKTLERLAQSAEDWNQLAAIADDLIEGVHTLALAGLSRVQQRSLLRALSGMGDLAAFAHVQCGRPERAFVILGLARAVGSELAFRLAARPQGPAGMAQGAFAGWQKRQAAAERQLRAALERTGQADPARAKQLEELRASYEALMAALAGTAAQEKAAIEVGAFSAHLEPECAAAAVYVSEKGGGILIVLPGDTTIAPGAVIDLPELTRARLEGLLHGNTKHKREGWLAAYEGYRKAPTSFDEAEIERAVAEWNGTIEAILPELWTLLMGPLAEWLREHARGVREIRLMVPGLLSLLPLHAARTAGVDARYFAEEWAVAYAPSPRAAMGSHELRPEEEAGLLAITDPAGDIGADVNPAWPFFAPTRRQSVRGDARAVSAALESARGVSHVSFFCHGLWEGADPDLSHLVMADGSQLSAQELASLDLRGVDLALLGACESALIGTRGTPDEFTGLPIALLQAGVRSVAASQWLVDAGSTYGLLYRMMQAHHAGLSPARALQAAQRAFLSGEMEDLDALPGAACFLSRLQTLRPLSPGEARLRDQAGEAVHQHDRPAVPARTAPFFWAAFAVIGRG